MLTAFLAMALLGQTQNTPKAAAPQEKPPFDSDALALEYFRTWKKVEQKALGMTPEHAARFKKANYEVFVRKMLKEHGLTEPQIRKAIREHQDRLAQLKAAEIRKAERVKARAERPERVQAGSTGRIEKDSLVTTSYLVMKEVYILLKAKDLDGLMMMVEKKQLGMAREPLMIRVLEVHDYSLIDKGHFVRVRLLQGPSKGSEVFCFPDDIELDEERQP